MTDGRSRSAAERSALTQARLDLLAHPRDDLARLLSPRLPAPFALALQRLVDQLDDAWTALELLAETQAALQRGRTDERIRTLVVVAIAVAAIGAVARRHVQAHYSRDAMRRRFEAFYEGLCRGRRPAVQPVRPAA